MLVNAINSAMCYPARHITWLYYISIQLNYFVIAGIFALFPTPVAKTFGSRYGAQVYAVTIMASPISSVFNTLIVKLLYKVIGEQAVLYIGTAASLIAIVINFFFTEELDTERLLNKNLIVDKRRHFKLDQGP